MRKDDGLFISIDGENKPDNSSQAKLLFERLKSAGYNVRHLSFPRHNEDSSYFIKEYKKGIYGKRKKVDPYTASMFFALDFYAAANSISEDLSQGNIVIVEGLTSSVMASEAMKFSSRDERAGYYRWLDAIVHKMFGVPRPNNSIFLRTETKSQQTGATYKVPNYYDEICEILPGSISQIDCVRSGELLDAFVISEIIWKTVEAELPMAKSSSGGKQQVQKDIAASKEIQSLAKKLMDKYTVYQAIHANLPKASYLGELLNIYEDLPTIESNELDKLTHKLISNGFGAPVEVGKVILISSTPKNEFDILKDVLFDHDGQSYVNSQERLDSADYESKVQLLLASRQIYSKHVHYMLEAGMTAADIRLLCKIVPEGAVQVQEISPRHGFVVPSFIEEPGLVDDYEYIFDEFLKQHSLPDNGRPNIMGGHILRVRLNLTLADVDILSKVPKDTRLQPIVKSIRELTSERHPILSTQENS